MAKRFSNTLTYGDVERSFRKKDFAPVYLFYGEEDLLIGETVDLLVQNSLDAAARQFNLDIVHGNEITASQLILLASAYPMAAERRVVIVREFDRLSNKEPLLRYLDRPSLSTSLVLIASRPDFRVKVFKTLSEKAATVRFSHLSERDVPTWITTRIEKGGKSISPDAVDLIRTYVGTSLREIQNEMDKLMIYVGERRIISADDVNAVVGMSKQFNIFELQHALGAGDPARAQEILKHMLDAGEGSTGIVVMLTRYFQKLWIIRDCLERKLPKQEIVGALQLSPGQAYYIDTEIEVAKKFASGRLERAFLALVDADERLKTSNGDEKMVMTLLVHQLSSGTTMAALGLANER